MTGPAEVPGSASRITCGSARACLHTQAEQMAGGTVQARERSFDEAEVQVLVAPGIPPRRPAGSGPDGERAGQSRDLGCQVDDEEAAQPHCPPATPQAQ